MRRVFISHSSQDRAAVEVQLVEFLRQNYVDNWYAARDIPPGRWEPEIRAGLEQCDWFLVALSPAALRSDWVKLEVELALNDPRFYERGHVVPVLLDDCRWQELDSRLGEFQLVDFTGEPAEGQDRLLATWKLERFSVPQYRVGNVLLPVYRIVGGDGQTRYRHPDGITANALADRFELPDDVARVAGPIVQRRRQDAEARGAVFENRPMVRLEQCSWRLSEPDERPWPLVLKVGLTDYFSMQATNVSVGETLADGLTIEQKYAGAIDDLPGSQLANPLATNLSLVTADRKIYVAQRSLRVGWNPGGFAPAVSGTGHPEKDLLDGVYSPFLTAQREATEEATWPLVPPLQQITFYGLARTFKYRFPFLFGELRLDITSSELESQSPRDNWETRGLVGIPFTVEDVTRWIVDRHRTVLGRRGLGPAVGTTLFSLLQSLLYEYPDQWPKVVEALS